MQTANDQTFSLESMEKEKISLIIDQLLKDIQDNKKKEMVSNFWNGQIVDYFAYLGETSRDIEEGSIRAEDISDEIMETTNNLLFKAYDFENELNDPDLSKKVKDHFRLAGAPFGLQSDFVKHALFKPHGYAGDFAVIEYIYDNKVSSTGAGYCADKAFLDVNTSVAVRARKNMMKKILTSYAKETAGSEQKILNIACGSCREIREMFQENNFGNDIKLQFTLVDQDKQALDFSEKVFENAPEGVGYEFIQKSVYKYVKNPDEYSSMKNKFDMVYTLGLADYILEEPLQKLILFLYDCVKPGGKLIIAHKDSRNHLPLMADWWADWKFHIRDEPEVLEMVKGSGIKNYEMTVERETEANMIFFMTIEKK